MSAVPSLSPQTTLGHYRLIEKLGAGGMGEVWKAHDVELHRTVALKFIPSTEQSSSTGHDIKREARAASALNHPNIVTIYEVGESAQGVYMAMEYVPGETLRARLQRGPMEFTEALDIAAQVAEGLRVAHRQGIVHRDLKPENILIREDGYAKLVDFGLAKRLQWIEGDASATATATGQLTGTFNYMSHEQARGQQVGPPSDVFAFGIVLHEMLCGSHPFRANTVIDTLQNILVAPVPAAPGVPERLGELLRRALAKDPSERYADAAGLSEALAGIARESASAEKPAGTASSAAPRRPFDRIRTPRWMLAVGSVLCVALLVLALVFGSSSGSKPSLPAIQSVAVLNFRTSGDSALATFAESVAENLSSELIHSGVQVSALSAVASLGNSVNPQEAGRTLKVDAVFAGSIRVSEGPPQLRIRVELVNSNTGFQVWSDTLTVRRGTPEASEEKVALEIVSRMRVALSVRE